MDVSADARPPESGAEPWDYVSPGLADPGLRRLFPRMTAGRRDDNSWSYLRRAVPHVWYVDACFPEMGFMSVDEASLLHALAQPFAGQPALEVGCWRGWSSAHLAAAGVVLDVVDPILADPNAREELRAIARATGAADRVTLYPLKSGEGIAAAAEGRGRPWSLMFIDGDHEAPQPRLDTLAALPHAAQDAMFVFHDLASPQVSAGLDALRERGWSTLVYQTMQIMGVAWRGKVEPVAHQPDPRVPWTLPRHLWAYPVSGEDEGERQVRFERVMVGHASLLNQLALVPEAADRMLSGVATASAFSHLGDLQRHVAPEDGASGAAQTLAAFGRLAEELDRLARDHASAMEAVFQLALERDDAREEISTLAALRAERDALVVKGEELAQMHLTLEAVRTELTAASQRVQELAPYANRAGRTQAALLKFVQAALSRSSG